MAALVKSSDNSTELLMSMPQLQDFLRVKGMATRSLPAASYDDARKFDERQAPVPWENLSGEIKILAKRAAAGSLEGLQVLVAWMQLNKITARQESLLPILYGYLDKEAPSKYEGLTKSEVRSVKCAAAALDGVLESFLWLPTIDSIDNSLTLWYFDHSWPAIWKWITYLYFGIYSNGLFRGIPKPLVEGSDDHRTVLTIRRLISVVFREDKPIYDTMLDTPGFFLLLADIWVRLSETRSGAVYSTEVCLAITCTLIRIIHDFNQARTFVEALDGDLSRLASLLLSNVRMAVDGRERALPTILPLVSFLTSMSVFIPELGNALLSQHSMVEVTRAFAYCAAGPTISPENEAGGPGYLVRSCVWSCLMYISATSKVSDGFTWITQAIRSRLIPSMLMSAALPRGPGLPRSLRIPTGPNHASSESIELEQLRMIETLSMYVVYRSVLKELERALDDPQIPILESRVPRDSAFWPAWANFRSLVSERISVRRNFDKTGKYSQQCAALECGKLETTKYFKLCSACQISVYCSKLCQTRDWKSGRHRAYCERVRKDRAEGKASPVSNHDHIFIKYNATFEIRKHRFSILRARDALFAETGSRDYVIYVDYTVCPLSIIVDIPESFPSSIRRAFLQRTPEDGEYPLINIIVSVPHGKTQQATVMSSDVAEYNNKWLAVILEGEDRSITFGDATLPDDGVVGRADRLEGREGYAIEDSASFELLWGFLRD
ncbi:hypothetical protein Hypma_010954 [Hypsizygus marmoreus]|uniref:MYND-type domain-containing protein n=1 Tax=Hypsizygus marmoreus TaxID=39966 RepID=A0A369JQT5_HYPMA|nr:hypothetical protein Hypma_010954 [Hypsizygus marmoreus]